MSLRPDSGQLATLAGACEGLRERLDRRAVAAPYHAVKAPPPRAAVAPRETSTLHAAITAHMAGRLDAAEAGYRAVLARDGRCAQAAHPLGVILLQAGRLEEAEATLARAVEAAPGWAEARNNHGVALRDLGRADEAAAAFRAAIAARPGLFDAHNNLAEALLETGAWGAAMESACVAQSLDAQHVGPLVTMAVVHFRWMEYPAAIERLTEVLARDPANARAAGLLQVAQSRLVEPWHFSMVNEVARNDAYDAALRRAVAPGALVLEIGTGAGLVAMMAARAGAGRVVTCEAVPTLAEKAREIVALNGYADRVTVHAKHSTALAVGAELPERAGVLVSELFDSNVLGEDVLASLEDAHARLLAPGAAVLPRAASARFELVGGGTLARLTRVDRAAGFDLSPFNAFTPERIIFDGSHVDYERLSDPATAIRFDLGAARHAPFEHLVTVPVTRAGECLGVVQWLHIDFDGASEYENRPRLGPASPSSWLHAFFSFPSPLRVEVGQTVHIVAGHSRKALHFRLAP